jgi:hypothetical protein
MRPGLHADNLVTPIAPVAEWIASTIADNS